MYKTVRPAVEYGLSAVEFRSIVLNSLNKLNKRDTLKTGSDELIRFIDDLRPEDESLTHYMNCILDDAENQSSAYKKEVLRILAIVASVHRNLLQPFLAKTVTMISKLLKDKDSAVRDTCAEAFAIVAANVYPTDAKASDPLGVYFAPLFGVLLEQNKQVQVGAAMCIAAVVAHSPPQYIAGHLQRVISRIQKHLSQPNCLARANLIAIFGSIAECVREQVITYVPTMLATVVDGFASPDWAARKSAAEVLSKLAAVLQQAMSPFRDEVLQILEQCKFDKIKPVRDAVQEAINTFQLLPVPGFAEGLANTSTQLSATQISTKLFKKKPLSASGKLSMTAGKSGGGGLGGTTRRTGGGTSSFDSPTTSSKAKAGPLRPGSPRSQMKTQRVVPHTIYVPSERPLPSPRQTDGFLVDSADEDDSSLMYVGHAAAAHDPAAAAAYHRNGQTHDEDDRLLLNQQQLQRHYDERQQSRAEQQQQMQQMQQQQRTSHHQEHYPDDDYFPQDDSAFGGDDRDASPASFDEPQPDQSSAARGAAAAGHGTPSSAAVGSPFHSGQQQQRSVGAIAASPMPTPRDLEDQMGRLSIGRRSPEPPTMTIESTSDQRATPPRPASRQARAANASRVIRDAISELANATGFGPNSRISPARATTLVEETGSALRQMNEHSVQTVQRIGQATLEALALSQEANELKWEELLKQIAEALKQQTELLRKFDDHVNETRRTFSNFDNRMHELEQKLQHAEDVANQAHTELVVQREVQAQMRPVQEGAAMAKQQAEFIQTLQSQLLQMQGQMQSQMNTQMQFTLQHLSPQKVQPPPPPPPRTLSVATSATGLDAAAWFGAGAASPGKTLSANPSAAAASNAPSATTPNSSSKYNGNNNNSNSSNAAAAAAGAGERGFERDRSDSSQRSAASMLSQGGVGGMAGMQRTPSGASAASAASARPVAAAPQQRSGGGLQLADDDARLESDDDDDRGSVVLESDASVTDGARKRKASDAASERSAAATDGAYSSAAYAREDDDGSVFDAPAAWTDNGDDDFDPAARDPSSSTAGLVRHSSSARSATNGAARGPSVHSSAPSTANSSRRPSSASQRPSRQAWPAAAADESADPQNAAAHRRLDLHQLPRQHSAGSGSSARSPGSSLASTPYSQTPRDAADAAGSEEVWRTTLGAVSVGHLDQAYKTLLDAGDTIQLVRLLQHTQPVLDRLQPDTASRLFLVFIKLLRNGHYVDIIYQWLSQALQRSMFPLGPAQMKELVRVLRDMSASPDQRGVQATSFLSKINKLLAQKPL